MIDIEQLINRSGRLSVAEIVKDDDFRRSFSSHTTFATAHASQLVFKRSYTDSQNQDFKRIHNESWAMLMNNLANWERLSGTLQLPRNEKILIAGWHFPEVPTLFSYARQVRALLLVSQDAPWLNSLKEEGCTLNISETNTTRRLIAEMQSGRIIAAMLDHSYPNTRTEKTTLLGRTVDTPSGIFDLCSRFGYLMVFVAPRKERIEIINRIDTTGKSASELAQQYTTWLEAEIRQAPSRWLMWQALPMH
ncbi:MAG TPA: hypothetical protein DCY88_05000 [Cyanobacteria bacterium UBA11372]|nr:hypothetical protein [Cyanobacteria bacterium UBA11372]HBE34780.1 hypothetical protein [Cyanobacteria bacterium UBA11368]